LTMKEEDVGYLCRRHDGVGAARYVAAPGEPGEY